MLQTAFLCRCSRRSRGRRPEVCAFVPAPASTGLPAGKIQHMLCLGGLASSEGLGSPFLLRRLKVLLLCSSHIHFSNA